MIYKLIHPITLLTYYVGYTAGGLLERYNQHVRNSKFRKTPKDIWIQHILKQGMRPLIICVCLADDNWQQQERDWIKYFRGLNPHLTNATEGGAGNPNPSTETRRKMSIAKLGKTGKLCPNSLRVELINMTTGITKKFDSKKLAASYLGISSKNLLRDFRRKGIINNYIFGYEDIID